MKKAQGLSLNMMILIALGLIVLVVVSLMFFRSSSSGKKTIENCANLGGECVVETLDPVTKETTSCAGGRSAIFLAKCNPVGTTNYVCCSKP